MLQKVYFYHLVLKIFTFSPSSSSMNINLNFFFVFGKQIIIRYIMVIHCWRKSFFSTLIYSKRNAFKHFHLHYARSMYLKEKVAIVTVLQKYLIYEVRDANNTFNTPIRHARSITLYYQDNFCRWKYFLSQQFLYSDKIATSIM